MRKVSFLPIIFLYLFSFTGTLIAGEIHLDLSDTLFSVTSGDGFKLFHIEAEGYPGRYWVEFKWNPGTLSFQPVDAGQEQGYVIISAQELHSMIVQGGSFTLLDVRTPEEYAKGHIQGALNYPTDKTLGDFPDSVKQQILQDFSNKESQIVVYCGGLGCGRSGWAADSLVEMGYTNVFRFKAGYSGWCEAGYNFVITAQELKDLIDDNDTGHTLVDVREEFEFAEDHIPTAINVPLSRIRNATSMADLSDVLPSQTGTCSDWTRPIIVYCAGTGTRYAEAAQRLASLGYMRLVAFPGGMEDWNSMESSYKYKTSEELASMLSSQAAVHVVDIRVKDEYDSAHIKGSIATYAYPVKTEEDKAKLDAIFDTLTADSASIVIICPRGAGGAERTYDYLKEEGIDESRLYILENGWAGWSQFLDLTEVSSR